MGIIIGVLFGTVLILLWLLFIQTKELECYMRICEKQERRLFELEAKLKELENV